MLDDGLLSFIFEEQNDLETKGAPGEDRKVWSIFNTCYIPKALFLSDILNWELESLLHQKKKKN